MMSRDILAAGVGFLATVVKKNRVGKGDLLHADARIRREGVVVGYLLAKRRWLFAPGA